MTPYILFLFMAAVAGGLLLIGLAVFAVACLFVGVIGWAKRPTPEPSILPIAPANPSMETRVPISG